MLRLVTANLNYSSWSMRAWLALRHAGLQFEREDVGLKTREGWKERILAVSGAGHVPILVDDTLVIHESLAICEYVAELRPEARLWPEARSARARGRAVAGEMHSGFQALRRELPCNLRARAKPRVFGAEARGDIARVQELWSACLDALGGPFLLGAFSIADCMYMPVAARFRTYGVPLSPAAARYSDAVLGLDIVQELEGIAAGEPAIAEYDAALSF